MDHTKYELHTAKKETINVTIDKEFIIQKTLLYWNGNNVFKLIFRGKVVMKYLGKSESELACWGFQGGILYKYEKLLGFYKSGLHLKRKAEKIVNIFCQPDDIYFLECSSIYRFNYKANRKRTGIFKLPIEKVIDIDNLHSMFDQSSLRQSFLFTRIEKIFVIISFSKIGIISGSSISQLITASNEIISIKSNIFEGIHKTFHLVQSSNNNPIQISDFKPTKKTILSLNKSYEITEIVDLFFFKFISDNIDKKLSVDWHLEPLDRSFLSSERFYQDKLYDYLQKYLGLTVQGLYLTNPDALLRLQEALREQEARIYADGHIPPDRTIASLIASSLPLPSSHDTATQSNIRSMFLNSLNSQIKL